MQQQRHKPPTDEFCPSCGADNREHWSAGKPPPFCMTCRFPLLLIAGKYRLLREIDEGGCGTVYEARHTKLSRDPKRAIKIIKPELMKRGGMKERFRREVQVTGSLSQENQHIVRIYDDFGEEPGLGYYYIMEFLQGHSVDDLLKSRKQELTVDLAFKLFEQLCDAMQDAHAEGIIHRDLKPENMFVVSKRREPHFLKVIDFGIAKPISQQDNALQLTGGALGTPAYMSPEQCINGEITARTDIYAMGCILFEMLAGFAPFSKHTLGGKEPNMLEMLTMHVKQSPPRVTDFLPADKQVPDSISDIIIKAMAKAPDDRYASIEQLEQAFQAAQEELGESTAIKPFKGTPLPTGHHTAGYRQDLPTAPPPHIETPMPAALVPQASGSVQHTIPYDSGETRAEQPALSSMSTVTPAPGDVEESKADRSFWLAGLVALLALSGAGVWYGVSRSTPKATPQGVSATPKRQEPRKTLTRPRPQAPLKAVPKARKMAPSIVPPRQPGLQRRQPRKRMIALIPTRIPKPRRRARRPKGRLIKQCPQVRGLYWVHLRMSRQLQRELKRRTSGSMRVIAARQGLCVGARSRRTTLELYARGVYHACRFKIWGQPKAQYRIQMYSEDDPAPHPTKITSYCLK